MTNLKLVVSWVVPPNRFRNVYKIDVLESHHKSGSIALEVLYSLQPIDNFLEVL